MKNFILSIIISLCVVSPVWSYDYNRPPTANPNDTAIINQLLSDPRLDRNDFGHNSAILAKLLIGKKYDDYYNTDSIGNLRIDINNFTPISFVNTVIALSKAYQSSTQPNWRDFSKHYQNISCRNGVDNGFASISWHASDWIVDNIYRGNIKELTENYSGKIEKTKSLDYLTRHREEFAALSDSLTYDKAVMWEMGFRTHRIPLLKKETINKKEIISDLKEGDIIVLNPSQDGKDYLLIGFIGGLDPVPSLIYMNPETQTIEEWTKGLGKLFQLKTKLFNGYRIIRPKFD